MKRSYVYILDSKAHGTIYVGVTSDLIRRVCEHRNGLAAGFTRIYGVHRLVYYEEYEDIRLAITREKQLKKWNRQWKMNLIGRSNPLWRDLYDGLVGDSGSPPARG